MSAESISYFTPIRGGGQIAEVAALYLTPLTRVTEIAVMSSSETYSKESYRQGYFATAVKIASYICSCGILPVLALIVHAVLRRGRHYVYQSASTTAPSSSVEPSQVRQVTLRTRLEHLRKALLLGGVMGGQGGTQMRATETAHQAVINFFHDFDRMPLSIQNQVKTKIKDNRCHQTFNDLLRYMEGGGCVDLSSRDLHHFLQNPRNNTWLDDLMIDMTAPS